MEVERERNKKESMYCEKIYQHTDQKITDREFELHLKHCSYCREMNSKIEETMSVLELRSDPPENLMESVLFKKNEWNEKKTGKPDLMTILQIASVVVAGIFLGIVLGRNSNTELIMGKDNQKEQGIIEYRDIHHLNTNQELF